MTTTSLSESSNRFEFGENWRQFVAKVTEAQIAEAGVSLERMLGPGSLRAKRFLDIGCGSGLFSLAARRLGAEVYSFDFDPLSVGCAQELKRIYCPGDPAWHIHRGSVLDPDFMDELGTFDIVYSWGVLHHTGAMWTALDLASRRVSVPGSLFIAIYNDQGVRSRLWWQVKRIYNRLPRALRPVYIGTLSVAMEIGAVGVALVRREPRRILDRWMRYHSLRGMSRWHDLVDWIGGFPFEVAKPETVFNFCRARGFALERLVTCGGKMGCNEFLFTRTQ